MKICVVGSGSWGTAISRLLAINGHDVTIWTREENVYNNILNGDNPYYLPGIPLPKSIQPSMNIADSTKDAEMIVLAVPAQAVRSVIKNIDNKEAIYINLSKGIEIESGKLISEVVIEELGSVKYCTLSGPSHAEEVARDIPTSVVVAGNDAEICKKVQSAASNVAFRIYTNNDLKGVELCGSIKNVYAIASGVIDGMGGWDNTKAALMTRALVEMSRFGEFFGAKKETFTGLAGIGDLIVTCTSRHSRNRYVGEMIGRGQKLADILKEMKMVAEGVYTAKAMYQLAIKNNIDMPLANKIYSVLYEDIDPKNAIHELMRRELKSE